MDRLSDSRHFSFRNILFGSMNEQARSHRQVRNGHVCLSRWCMQGCERCIRERIGALLYHERVVEGLVLV